VCDVHSFSTRKCWQWLQSPTLPLSSEFNFFDGENGDINGTYNQLLWFGCVSKCGLIHPLFFGHSHGDDACLSGNEMIIQWITQLGHQILGRFSYSKLLKKTSIFLGDFQPPFDDSGGYPMLKPWGPGFHFPRSETTEPRARDGALARNDRGDPGVSSKMAEMIPEWTEMPEIEILNMFKPH